MSSVKNGAFRLGGIRRSVLHLQLVEHQVYHLIFLNIVIGLEFLENQLIIGRF